MSTKDSESGEGAVVIVDAQGLLCPEPVMLLHNAVRDANSGQCIKLLATDPSTQRDVIKFCTFLQHELMSQEENSGVYTYLLKKGG